MVSTSFVSVYRHHGGTAIDKTIHFDFSDTILKYSFHFLAEYDILVPVMPYGNLP